MTYIIILNYNGAADTEKCLTSIAKTKNAAYKTVVVDNHSTDNSAKIIEKWIAEHANVSVTLLRAKKNMGYSGGNNIGIKFAMSKADCEYLWILNNDTEVDEYALANMIKKQQSTGCDGVGSAVLWHENRGKVQCVGGRLDEEEFCLNLVAEGVNTKELKPDLKILTLPGPSFLLTAKLIKAVGLLDESYFLYCEELELAFRAKKAGLSFCYAEDAFVYHKGSASAGKECTSYRDYHMTRSWLIFISRHLPKKRAKFITRQKKIIITKLFHFHFKRAWAIYRAITEHDL